MIMEYYKIKLRLILILFTSVGFLLTGCQNLEEENPNIFMGKWVSQGLFLEDGITEDTLTAQEKLGISYIKAYFKEGTIIEFMEKGALKIPDIGEGKYEITKDNRLKIMNDLAGILLDYEIDEEIVLIKTNKMYIKLVRDNGKIAE